MSNSKLGIDAHASNVSVVIDFQRLTVKVIDDGEGILPEDLTNIGKLRYTSKWNPNSKLSALGYKGLALASIATLSRVTINSRHITHNTTKSVRVNFGKRTSVYNSSEPRSKSGTVITITGLFSQMPARQKHTQSTSATTHIEHLKKAITPIAISRPNVTLSFHDTDNKTILHILGSSCSSDPRDVSVLQAVHGSHIADRWQTIHTKVRDIDVRATIAFDPVKNKRSQHIVINSQRIDDTKLYSDLNNLLSTLCSARDHSDATLYMAYVFEVNYDTNLGEYAFDPISSEIPTQRLEYISNLLIITVQKFLKAHGYYTKKRKAKPTLANDTKKQRPLLVDALVNSGVRQARFDLKEKSGRLISNNSNKENEDTLVRASNDSQNLKHSSIDSCCDSCVFEKPNGRLSLMTAPQQLVHEKLLKVDKPLKCKESELSKHFIDVIQSYRDSKDNTAFEQKFSKSDFSSLSLISQVDNKFLLITIDNSARKTKCVAIIDQHAADERVKLESLLNSITHQALQFTSLPLRSHWESKISEQEYKFFKNNGKLYSQFGILYRLGFKSGNKSKPFLQLTHIPEMGMGKVDDNKGINPKFAQKLIFSYAKDIMDRKVSSLPLNNESHWSVLIRNYPVALLELYQSKACRSAIMFGDKLSFEEASVLIQNLSGCIFPFQCAHGRPSIVPLLDLAK